MRAAPGRPHCRAAGRPPAGGLDSESETASESESDLNINVTVASVKFNFKSSLASWPTSFTVEGARA